MGFLFNNLKYTSAYMRQGWNILDFIVVAASVVDFVFSISGTKGGGNTLKSLKALRALRALRPLRMISRNEGLKLVVNALLTSIPGMTNVLLVCSLFLMIFAITGINFYKGQFFSCSLDDSPSIVTKFDCINQGGEWKNSRSNFDNIFDAMLCLFEMMTTEGWLDVMYSGVDAVGIGMQPKKNNSPLSMLFFAAFMVVGSQFILNLFVGVIIDNFNKIKDLSETGGALLTEQQREWIEIQKVMVMLPLLKKEKKPTNRCRLAIYKLVKHNLFDLFIMVCILLNTVTMSMRYEAMGSWYEQLLEYCNTVFNVIFNLEAAVKLIAMGKYYFNESWNNFDFLVVVITDFGLVISQFEIDSSLTTAVTVIRAFRIMRIFRLIKSAKNIKIILDTLINILPQIANVMSLILLLLFIFAALGVNLFSGVIYQDNINEKANFRSFISAIVLLLRCATGENWNLIMGDLSNTVGFNGVQCISSQDFYSQQQLGIIGCGNSFSYAFFLSFTVIISMVIMNLSVAAVIDGLENARKENCGLVSVDDINQLISIWSDYDPDGTGWIDSTNLIFFLHELPPIFQYKTLKEEKKEAGEELAR